MSKWQAIDLDSYADLGAVPDVPGVYVVYAWEIPAIGYYLEYIGSSLNLRTRLKQHFRRHGRPGGPFDYECLIPGVADAWLDGCEDHQFRVAWKATRGIGDHLRLEARLIHRMRPSANRRGLPVT